VLRIKEKINNGPAEVRRKESNKNNMKNKGHKKNVFIGQCGRAVSSCNNALPHPLLSLQ
jgi:hypothetical protein